MKLQIYLKIKKLLKTFFLKKKKKEKEKEKRFGLG
jgi:hypothetical protein